MIKLEKSHLVAWDDPRGWGFCEGCAFQIPTDVFTGVLFRHSRSIGSAENLCDGSGLPPTAQPALEVKPKNTAGCTPPPAPRGPTGVMHGYEPE